MPERIERILLRAIAICGTIIFLFLVYWSWRYTRRLAFGEILLDEGDAVWRNILCALGIILLICFLNKVSDKMSVTAVNILAVCCSCFVAFGAFALIRNGNSYPVGDQLQVYLAADALFSGETEWLKSYEYFYAYPYQLGLADLYALFFRCAGRSSYLVIQCVQAIFSGLSVYAGYRITREIFGKRQAECVYLLLAVLFCPLYFYATYIYGETIGLCCVLYAIRFFLPSLKEWNSKSAKGYIYMGLTAVFLTITYVIRSALLVVWAAMVILLFIQFLKKKKIMPLFLTLVMLPVMLLGQKAVLDLTENKVGTEFGSGCPVALWIAMGLQEGEGQRGPGSFNGFNSTTYIACDYDEEKASEAAKESIRETFRNWEKNPKDMIRFFKEKIVNQWNEPTYGAIIMTCYLQEPADWVQSLYDGESNKVLREFTDRYQSICYLFLLGYFVILIWRKEELSMYLLGLILLGGFCFSLLWEAKSRYVFPYMMMAIPCVAASMVYYTDKLLKLFQQGLERLKERKNMEE